MLYMILGEDRPDSLKARQSVRPEHLARLNALQDAGRLVLAGPLPTVDAEDPGPAGFRGSLIIAEFSDLDAARTWAEDDPYLQTGVYESVRVSPFKKVLP